jgi:hypothetical protein
MTRKAQFDKRAFLALLERCERAERERDSQALELQAEKYCHRKDNEYLLPLKDRWRAHAHRLWQERDEALAEAKGIEMLAHVKAACRLGP